MHRKDGLRTLKDIIGHVHNVQNWEVQKNGGEQACIHWKKPVFVSFNWCF